MTQQIRCIKTINLLLSFIYEQTGWLIFDQGWMYPRDALNSVTVPSKALVRLFSQQTIASTIIKQTFHVLVDICVGNVSPESGSIRWCYACSGTTSNIPVAKFGLWSCLKETGQSRSENLGKCRSSKMLFLNKQRPCFHSFHMQYFSLIKPSFTFAWHCLP